MFVFWKALRLFPKLNSSFEKNLPIIGEFPPKVFPQPFSAVHQSKPRPLPRFFNSLFTILLVIRRHSARAMHSASKWTTNKQITFSPVETVFMFSVSICDTELCAAIWYAARQNSVLPKLVVMTYCIHSTVHCCHKAVCVPHQNQTVCASQAESVMKVATNDEAVSALYRTVQVTACNNSTRC